MGLKFQRSLDSYESNEGTKNKKQNQDETIQYISSKIGEELNEEDAEEKTLLKRTQEPDTCATTSKVKNSKYFYKCSR